VEGGVSVVLVEVFAAGEMGCPAEVEVVERLLIVVAVVGFRLGIVFVVVVPVGTGSYGLALRVD